MNFPAVRTLNDENFEDSIKGGAVNVVLVDFYSQWCGACRKLEPTLEKLAREYHGRVEIAKLNVDENDEIAEKYNIKSLPTMLIFHDGRLKKQLIGAKSASKLRSKLDKYHKNSAKPNFLLRIFP